VNVLVLSQYFWPENFPINNLVKALSTKGVFVDVLTGQPNYPGGRILDGYRAWRCVKQEWSGVTLHRLPLMPRGRGSAVGLALNYLSFVVSGLLLAPWVLRRKRVDVVFVYAISPILQAIPAILVKWVKGAKLAIWVQDLWPESLEATGFVRNRFLLAAMKVVVRWIYRHADMILVQSEAFIEPVAALAERNKIVYYPNSADDVFLSPATVTDCSIDGLNEGFSVAFAGNLGSAQAIETIVEAAALLQDRPDIRIFLIGDGSRADWIKEQIRMRGLPNVILPGRYPIESMPAVLRQAGALLVTLKDQPIFHYVVPSKLQVYLAIGRPIVAGLNGEGARVVAQAEAGICCPAEDAVSLADAIKRLSDMPVSERDRMGQNGISFFQSHYDKDMLMQSLIAHFDNLVNGSFRGRP
jgi:glycosyltransferase involved in cell wall biosynthesis